MYGSHHTFTPGMHYRDLLMTAIRGQQEALSAAGRLGVLNTDAYPPPVTPRGGVKGPDTTRNSLREFWRKQLAPFLLLRPSRLLQQGTDQHVVASMGLESAASTRDAMDLLAAVPWVSVPGQGKANGAAGDSQISSLSVAVFVDPVSLLGLQTALAAVRAALAASGASAGSAPTRVALVPVAVTAGADPSPSIQQRAGCLLTRLVLAIGGFANEGAPVSLATAEAVLRGVIRVAGIKAPHPLSAADVEGVISTVDGAAESADTVEKDKAALAAAVKSDGDVPRTTALLSALARTATAVYGLPLAAVISFSGDVASPVASDSVTLSTSPLATGYVGINSRIVEVTHADLPFVSLTTPLAASVASVISAADALADDLSRVIGFAGAATQSLGLCAAITAGLPHTPTSIVEIAHALSSLPSSSSKAAALALPVSAAATLSNICLLAQSALALKAATVTSSLSESHPAPSAGASSVGGGKNDGHSPAHLPDLSAFSSAGVYDSGASPASAAVDVVALVDPCSSAAQSLLPLLVYLRDRAGFRVRVVLTARSSFEAGLPVRRFTAAALSPALSFDAATGARLPAPPVRFKALQTPHLLTLAVFTPEPWLVSLAEADHDMDNFRIVDRVRHPGAGAAALSSAGSEAVPRVVVRYDLASIVFAGQGLDGKTGEPAAGIQLVAARAAALSFDTPSRSRRTSAVLLPSTPPSSPSASGSSGENPAVVHLESSDTTVMETLGYFQLKAQPGLYLLHAAPQHALLTRLTELAGQKSTATQAVEANSERLAARAAARVFLAARSLSAGDKLTAESVEAVAAASYPETQAGPASARRAPTAASATSSNTTATQFERAARAIVAAASSERSPLESGPLASVEARAIPLDEESSPDAGTQSRARASLYLPVVLSSFAPRYSQLFFQRPPGAESIKLDEADAIYEREVKRRQAFFARNPASLAAVNAAAALTTWRAGVPSPAVKADIGDTAPTAAAAVPLRKGETLHIFSIASGHLYERFLKVRTAQAVIGGEPAIHYSHSVPHVLPFNVLFCPLLPADYDALDLQEDALACQVLVHRELPLTTVQTHSAGHGGQVWV